MGCGIHAWIGCCDFRSGHNPRGAVAGDNRVRARLWRRLVGMAVAVQPLDRRRPGHRLCAARVLLADLENRRRIAGSRSEEHTSELQSIMRISYAVFCLKKKKYN